MSSLFVHLLFRSNQGLLSETVWSCAFRDINWWLHKLQNFETSKQTALTISTELVDSLERSYIFSTGIIVKINKRHSHKCSISGSIPSSSFTKGYSLNIIFHYYLPTCRAIVLSAKSFEKCFFTHVGKFCSRVLKSMLYHTLNLLRRQLFCVLFEHRNMYCKYVFWTLLSHAKYFACRVGIHLCRCSAWKAHVLSKIRMIGTHRALKVFSFEVVEQNLYRILHKNFIETLQLVPQIWERNFGRNHADVPYRTIVLCEKFFETWTPTWTPAFSWRLLSKSAESCCLLLSFVLSPDCALCVENHIQRFWHIHNPEYAGVFWNNLLVQ